MGRLVDTDDVIKAVDRHVKEDAEAVLDDDISCILEEVPTAYDVEKVVKELKEWTFNADINIGDGTIMNHNLIVSENAIDTVREGGTK